MGNRRSQLSQGRHASDGQEFGPRLLPLRFGALAAGEVADNADEDGLAVLPGLTDGKVHRESRAVLAAANDLTAAADDLGVARVPIVGDVAIVFMPVRLRHQHLYVDRKSV